MRKLVDRAEKMFSKKTSFQLLKESFTIILPSSKNIKTILFISSISMICAILIGFSFQTVEWFKDILSYIIEIDIALLGIVFTGYVFFQVLVNKELLKRLISEKHDDNESKLQESNEYFIGVMILYILFIFICIILKILFFKVDDSFLVFSNQCVNCIWATLLLFLFLYYAFALLWEIKSFIFNIFQIFNGYTATQILEYIKENKNGNSN